MMTMYINPYRRLASLREAMDRIIEDGMTDSNAGEREMLLGVDVLAEDEAYTIHALVPGLEADSLDIEILNNTVTIQGEFTKEAPENAKFVVSELPSGRFSRVVSLPVVLDSVKAEAALKDGVLTLRVPKAESHRPKAVKVNAG